MANSKSVSTAPEEAAHEELPSAEPQEELPEESPEESEALSEEPLDVTQEGLIYTDDRVPNYTAANPLWQTLHFAWESQDKRGTVQVDISIDSEMYRYYRGLGRYYGADEYQNYVNDANNKKIAAELVSAIRSASNSGAQSDAAVVREIAKFVQDTITYQYDLDTTGEDEYPRYPIETLYERQGDCEDTQHSYGGASEGIRLRGRLFASAGDTWLSCCEPQMIIPAGPITKSTDIAICILKARQADGISAISQRTS